MELRQLEYFQAVAAHTNFTKAAEALHISQPAITTAIKNMEEELGVTLFVRDKRKVILTYEGRLFLEKITPLLTQLKEAIEDIQKLSDDYDKILNIGLTPVAGSELAANLYSGFSKMYPDIRFEVLELGSYGIIEAIDRNEIDIGFMVILDEARDNYDICSIEKGTIKAVMHRDNPLSSLDKVTIEQLADHPLFPIPSHAFAGRKIDEAFVKAGLPLNVVSRPSQMFTVFNLVQQNIGISFVLGDGFSHVMQNKNLISIPLDPPIDYEIGFVWKKGKKLNKAARRCISYVRQYMYGETIE